MHVLDYREELDVEHARLRRPLCRLVVTEEGEPVKIVIEIDGEKVTAVSPVLQAPAPAVPSAEPAPGAAPAAVLERARKLGALSAGAARLGTGAALFAAAMPGEILRRPEPVEVETSAASREQPKTTPKRRSRRRNTR
jgi:hypothetical protein